EIAAALPGKATHFVSSRLRADRLAFLAQAGAPDLGWQIQPADYARSTRSTLSHWATRVERFTAANVRPSRLAEVDGSGPPPPGHRLLPLGFRYSCRISPGACRAESCSAATGETPWIRFKTLALPPREVILEWVAEHYQYGCPLFLSATSQRLDLVQELLR